MAYRVFGSTGSGYSVKVRSYFRYKDIDHVWLVRNTPELGKEFAKAAKLPIVPTVIAPDGKALQDSTPIIEALEAANPAPSIHPQDACLRFLSELLEEFADEWGNKWMMHLRWYSTRSGPDAERYSRAIATEMKSGTPPGNPAIGDELAAIANTFKERMLDRGFTVGSNATTAPIIEKSFLDTILLLEAHLANRPYMFGGSPSMADFGLFGQLYQCLTDVTAGELMRLHAPHVALWVDRMLNPRDVGGGGFEGLESLAPTLEPLLRTQVAMFLKWSDANAKALAAKSTEMTLDLGDRPWTQSVGGPQKYHAKSLQVIRGKYAQAAASSGSLNDILSRCDCLELLQAVGASKL